MNFDDLLLQKRGKAILVWGPPKVSPSISQRPGFYPHKWGLLAIVKKKKKGLSSLITLKKFFLLEMILEISLSARLASSRSLVRETNLSTVT